jgi:HEAT repeat protein
VDELIGIALCESDEDPHWDAIWALRRHGTQEVFERAVELCRSGCAFERRLGADILGQLGVPDRTFPKESLQALLNLLEGETDPNVLNSVLVALGHIKDRAAIAPSLGFLSHADAAVRYGLVFALTGYDDPRAIAALIELTKDSDTEIRDWATFGLGSIIEEVDTPELRDALFERLSDSGWMTRCEAIVGLAHRKDARAVPAIAAELSSGDVGSLAVEAASLIGDQTLHPALIALRKWWDVDVDLLEEAIRACSPESARIA